MLLDLEQARRELSRISRELTEQRKTGKRTCSNCKELKGPEGFYKHANEPYSWCKACMNESKRAWRARNRERERENSLRHYRAVRADPVRWAARLAAQQARRKKRAA